MHIALPTTDWNLVINSMRVAASVYDQDADLMTTVSTSIGHDRTAAQFRKQAIDARAIATAIELQV